MKKLYIPFLFIVLFTSSILSMHKISHIAHRAKSLCTTLCIHSYKANLPRRFARNKLDVRKLKGSYSDINPKHRHLSIINGIPLIETSFLKNIWIHGNDKDPATQLTRNIFYKNQYDEFKNTYNKSLPGYSLDEELVGDIIGALETNTLDKINIQNKIIKKWKKAHLHYAKCTLTHNKIKNILSMIITGNNKYRVKESHLTYPPFIIQHILQAFLYQKLDTRTQVDKYTQAIHTYIPELFIATPQTVSSEQLQPKQKNLTYLFEHYYEDIICEKVLLEACAHNIPPVIQGSYYGYQNKDKGPNCVEACLQNFFNILFTNPDSRSFDCSMLPAHIKPHEQLVQFYKQYPTFYDGTLPEAGQVWFNLLSNIADIEYVSGNYGAVAQKKNILNIINFLLKTNATWDELGAQLSTTHRKIMFKERENIISINIMSKDKINTFILEINDNQHARMHFFMPKTKEKKQSKLTTFASSKKANMNLAHILPYLFFYPMSLPTSSTQYPYLSHVKSYINQEIDRNKSKKKSG